MSTGKQLTSKQIENAKPKEKPYKLYDRNQSYLLVQPTGSKLWRMDYSFNGKRKTASLGKFPLVSLATFREKVVSLLKMISEGTDPIAKKRQEQEATIKQEQKNTLTFEIVAMEWFERKTGHLKEVTRKAKLQRLQRLVFPYIGTIPITQLQLQQIVDTILKIKDATDTPKRVAQVIGQISRYACLMGYIQNDISAGIMEALPSFPPHKHHATITDPSEFQVLLKNINEYSGSISVMYALKLMPFVFVRSFELRGARWAEFNFEQALWTIPSDRMKMKRQHVVPLARQVIEILKELHNFSGKSELLFPSTFSRTQPITDTGLLNAIRRMGYDKDEMTIHGFRASASTILNENGYRPDVIEAQLAHGERNAVRDAYNHAEYMTERKQMMQDWADYIEALRDGVPPDKAAQLFKHGA